MVEIFQHQHDLSGIKPCVWFTVADNYYIEVEVLQSTYSLYRVVSTMPMESMERREGAQREEVGC